MLASRGYFIVYTVQGIHCSTQKSIAAGQDLQTSESHRGTICWFGLSFSLFSGSFLTLGLLSDYEWWFDINMQPVGTSSFTDMTVRRQERKGRKCRWSVVVEEN